MAGNNNRVSDHSRSQFPPLDPNELAEDAGRFEWNPQIPIKYYVRSLDALYREGRNYLLERNYAKAYFLLFRFSILYIDKVSSLPQANTAEGRRLLKPARRRIQSVLAELEEIKPYLIEARKEWAADHAAELPQYAVNSDAAFAGYAARDAALSWNAKAQAKLLDVTEHQDLAVDLATTELRRRSAARRSSTSHATSAAEDSSLRRSGGVWENQHRSARSSLPASDAEMRQQMELARRQLDQRDNEGVLAAQALSGTDHQGDPMPSTYHYPSVTRSSPLQYSPDRPQKAASDRSYERTHPPLPPKIAPNASYGRDFVPSIAPEQRTLAASSGAPPLHRSAVPEAPGDTAPPARPPKISGSEPQGERFTFRPAAYLEDGTPIRPVFFPLGLQSDFVRLAASNTKRGIETCGLLCGTSVNNALFITCLLVPQQHGTSDTCETTNEAATFEFFEKEDYLQIGWIHTHPTQTCFMSSRDLHTHAGYQIMMDESIAIVCSPNHDPSWGVFRLTKPPGLQHLLQCDETDTFHQHSLPADALYTEALNPPGHVFVSSRMDYWIRDLREET